LEIEEILNLISLYGFPIVLSIYLIIKLEGLITEITKVNSRLTDGILKDIADIKDDINEIRVEIARRGLSDGKQI
jgi:hypothetical protein